MSQHPSLRSSDKDKQHRSVLKRYERIKILKEKEKWKDEDSIYGLQKVKVVKFKVKKEKAAAAETAEGAEGVVPAAEGAAPAAGGAKTAAAAKAPVAKTPSAKDAGKSASPGQKEAK
jgi:small basic protein (TIGR04137 family)